MDKFYIEYEEDVSPEIDLSLKNPNLVYSLIEDHYVSYNKRFNFDAYLKRLCIDEDDLYERDIVDKYFEDFIAEFDENIISVTIFASERFTLFILDPDSVMSQGLEQYRV